MNKDLPLMMTVEEAAATIGVPPGSLRRAAKQHGYLVQMGRHLRIERRTLEELIAKCRVDPEEHASTDGRTRAYSSSEMVDDMCRQVLETAEQLMRPSRDISSDETDLQK